MNNLYIIHHNQKVYVTLVSTFTKFNRPYARVRAIDGFPFEGTNLEACGESSGTGACPMYNELECRVFLVKVEESNPLQSRQDSILDELKSGLLTEKQSDELIDELAEIETKLNPSIVYEIGNSLIPTGQIPDSICPKCGGSLCVINKREYMTLEHNRQFVGCMNYPKCGYMAKKISADVIAKMNNVQVERDLQCVEF